MQAAQRLGISQGTLSQAERTGDGSALVAKYAALYGVNPLWLTDGSGEMQQEVAPIAHALSYLPFDDPVLTREDLMTESERPARFIYALEDDAMGKHGKAGDQVLFDRDRVPRIGSGVLVMTDSGEVHVRRVAQGRREGHWLAVPVNPLYRAMDSEADELRVLGVWKSNLDQGLEDA